MQKGWDRQLSHSLLSTCQKWTLPYAEKGHILRMNKLERQKRNRRIINWSLVALVIVALLVVVLVDQISNQKAEATLTIEEAQAEIRNQLDELPTAVALPTKQLVQNTVVEVLSVEPGGTREFVAKVKYTTIDVAQLYKDHKNEIFLTAYNYSQREQAAGKKVNATLLQIQVMGYVQNQLKDEKYAGKTGEVEVKFYDVRGDKLAMHLSDEVMDALLGGYITVRNDVASTTQVEVKAGEFVSIEKDNTIRNGINQCFGVDNYDSEKPDTSSPLQQKWNSLKADFHKNFIVEDRWLYLVEGLGNTLAITGLSLLLGIVLGMLTAIVRIVYDKTGRMYYLDRIAKLYISIIRGTPVMVQLLIIYFVLLLPIGVEKFPAAVLCFGLNSGAYVSEIIRGGIMSIDVGQTEAGRSLGFGFGATMWHIVMPQAFKAVLPALCNEFITLLKETSVAFYIGVADLTRGGIKIRSITYSNFMPLIAIALIYLVLVLILTKLVGILERRLRKSER